MLHACPNRGLDAIRALWKRHEAVCAKHPCHGSRFQTQRVREVSKNPRRNMVNLPIKKLTRFRGQPDAEASYCREDEQESQRAFEYNHALSRCTRYSYIRSN